MWFMDKKVDLYSLKQSYVDEFGITHQQTGYNKIKTIKADIQPYSKIKLQKDYGYDLECTKRMFVDIDKDITESTLIKYKEQFYSIQKIINWDSYLDIMLLEKDNI